MADKLTQEQRLKQIITRLKNSNARLRLKNGTLEKELRLLIQKVIDLENKLKDKELQRNNLLNRLYKPNKVQNNDSQPLGKKPGSQGYHRPKPKDNEVTQTTEFHPSCCPYCHRSDGLSPAQETITKYQEDIVIIPQKIVRKFIFTKHWCSHCQEYIRSGNTAVDLERLGPNVMAYILYARYRLRLPYNKIKQSLKDLHNFEISEGEITNQLAKAKDLFVDDFEAVKQLIKISDKVYCDETGWRVQGSNFWIWVFIVPGKATRYVIEDSRGKGVAENALANNEQRVLISDFYGAYKNLPGEHQYCWVHLLRDSKLTESKFHQDVKQAYVELNQELTKDIQKRRYKRLDELLEKIGQIKYTDKNILQVEKLQKRILTNKDRLLTCLKYKDILPHNNLAEQSLRNNVVMRKIFGGSRSIHGAKVFETNISVIDSLLQRSPGKGFFEVVLPKLKKLRGRTVKEVSKIC